MNGEGDGQEAATSLELTIRRRGRSLIDAIVEEGLEAALGGGDPAGTGRAKIRPRFAPRPPGGQMTPSRQLYEQRPALSIRRCTAHNLRNLEATNLPVSAGSLYSLLPCVTALALE